ncbi:MAG: DNA-3-methyladenine glycosylase [Fimbriimonadaceae bacterium]|nr:DNA-3-methyladenine glycosylase [Alphaproteobacteria bacterium]
MRIIETEADIREGVAALVEIDPIIGKIVGLTGMPPLRRREPGFAGMMRIVSGQQLSVASANAIWNRVEAKIKPMSAEKMLRVRDATLRGCGFSGPKIRTARAVSAAILDGSLDLDLIDTLSIEDAMEMLCAVKGIGPWTAEIYLMFCLGHPDIWPGGDLALQIAVQDAHEFENRPSAAACVEIAERWQPWRGVAARLFWAYYAVRRKPTSGAPV